MPRWICSPERDVEIRISPRSTSHCRPFFYGVFRLGHKLGQSGEGKALSCLDRVFCDPGEPACECLQSIYLRVDPDDVLGLWLAGV